MKFPEIPGPPGRTPRERFMDVVRHVLSVSKEELDTRETVSRQTRTEKKQQRQAKRPRKKE